MSSESKRPFPWMIVTLVVLAGLLGWRMASGPGGANVRSAASEPSLQVGMTVAASQETYACNTPELSGQIAVFQVVGAKDKLRDLLDRAACVRVAPPQRFKILELKDKLAQVLKPGAAPQSATWTPARDLAPVAP